MGLTINPTVSGSTRRFLQQSTMFFIGAALGGLVALLLVTLLFEVASEFLSVQQVRFLFVGITGLAILKDLGAPLPMPYRNRQVPEWFRDVMPQEVVAFTFGLMLGVGFLTLFTFSTQLAVLLMLPLADSLSPMLGGVVLIAAGKTIVLAGSLTSTSFDEVVDRFEAMRTKGRSRRVALRVATVVSSVTAIVAMLS